MSDANKGPVKLTVNGRAVEAKADPDQPLLFVLREELGLTATHLGCGANQCGACHVIVDGHAVASCDTPLWAAAGKSVTTAEGLGTPDKPHPSGILTTAAALLQQKPNPTEAEVRAALDRNLCRCGAHNRIVRAVLRAARTVEPAG
jgi:nicotinate dehydrogenase subunit A